MAKAISGRFTAEMDGTFVVFVIGMRINKLLAVHKWLPVLRSMGPMMRELYANPDTGFMSHEMHLGARGPVLLGVGDPMTSWSAMRGAAFIWRPGRGSIVPLERTGRSASSMKHM